MKTKLQEEILRINELIGIKSNLLIEQFNFLKKLLSKGMGLTPELWTEFRDAFWRFNERNPGRALWVQGDSQFFNWANKPELLGELLENLEKGEFKNIKKWYVDLVNRKLIMTPEKFKSLGRSGVIKLFKDEDPYVSDELIKRYIHWFEGINPQVKNLETKIPTQVGKVVSKNIIKNPKVIVRGTKDGLENQSFKNIDKKTLSTYFGKIPDNRRFISRNEPLYREADLKNGEKWVGYSVPALDRVRRWGYLEIGVLVPTNQNVEKDILIQVMEKHLPNLKGNKYTLELGNVQQSQFDNLASDLENALEKGSL